MLKKRYTHCIGSHFGSCCFSVYSWFQKLRVYIFRILLLGLQSQFRSPWREYFLGSAIKAFD